MNLNLEVEETDRVRPGQPTDSPNRRVGTQKTKDESRTIRSNDRGSPTLFPLHSKFPRSFQSKRYSTGSTKTRPIPPNSLGGVRSARTPKRVDVKRTMTGYGKGPTGEEQKGSRGPLGHQGGR